MTVHLVATTDGQYELEPSPVDPAAGRDAGGFWARRLDRLRTAWDRAVEQAHQRSSGGVWARWRSRLVRDVDESIEEQRSLWALRDRVTATLAYPAELSLEDASGILRGLLARARRRHGRWLVIDTALFVASGLLMILPGPNLVAYYFAFRVIGHYLSWRGARQALDVISWTFEPRS